jgi:hypothetical protein
MLQKVFATEVTGKADMARLEAVVVGLLGGEHHRCSFLRSGEYQRFRNAALYGNRARRVVEEEEKADSAPLSVHIEGLKLVLTCTRLACVYVTDPVVVPVPPPPTTSWEIAEEDEAFACSSLVGKRRRMVPVDSDDD